MDNKQLCYRITAHANLKYYLYSNGTNNKTAVGGTVPLRPRDLLKILKIPESEVMAVTVNGKNVKLDVLLEESCEVEIFPRNSKWN